MTWVLMVEASRARRDLVVAAGEPARRVGVEQHSAGVRIDVEPTGEAGLEHAARPAESDRVLSDEQWADIARELLDGAGIAARDDLGGPRWVAIRHPDDHVHIAADLVRQDTGRRFWPHHDFPTLRATARDIEQRLGLTVTAGADRTAARRPHRGEVEKAARQSRRPARPELRRAVQQAAIRAGGPDEFVATLREMCYLAELRRGTLG